MKKYFNKTNDFYIVTLLLAFIFITHLNILFAPVETFFSGFEKIDLCYYINIRQYAFDTIKAGIFPLWTTKIFCGTPFFANSETAIFYLPNIIFFFLPISKAINFSFLIHFFILSFSVFLWINNKIKDKFIALIISIISIFISNFYLHFYAAHLSNIITACWFPLLLYFYDKTFNNKNYFNIFPITFIISLQIFAGHFQYVYYTALVSLIYVLIFCRNKHTLIVIISSYFISVFLTAIQLIPGYSFYLEGGRRFNIFDTGNVYICSELKYLLTLFLNINIPFTSELFWETSNYFGALNFFIIIMTLLYIHNKNILKNIILVIFLYLLTFQPFSNLAKNIIPCFSWFRGSVKLIFFANILLLPILAYGIKFIMSQRTKIKIHYIIFILVIFFISVFFKSNIVDIITYGYSINENSIEALKFYLLIFAFLFLFFSILLYLKKYSISKIIIIALLIIDPLITMKIFSRPFIYKTNYTYNYILKEKFNEQPRFSSTNRYSLKYNSENTSGLFPDKLKNYLIFDKKNKNDNILSLLRCKYIVDDHSGVVTGRENKTLNRINIFYNYIVEKNKENAYDILSDKNFNVFDTVVLEQEPKFKPKSKGNYNIEILYFNENSIEFECNTTEPAIILYTDNYAQGWKAYNIDNPKQKHEIICADYIYKAISIDKGRHKIRIEYKPISFFIGMWISIFSWIIFFTLLFAYKRNFTKKGKQK